MATKLPVLQLFTGLTILASSCAPAYVPNVINAPLLTNKKEVQVSVHAGTAGFDPQVAWAVTNHIGLMANASFRDETADSTDSYHKHTFLEFGAGYYTNFAQRFKFETFGGAGFGSIAAYYENDNWNSFSQVNVKRYYLQPSLGLTSKMIDFGISARFSLLNMKQELFSITELMIEPAATLKVGWNHLKAVAQLGLSAPVTKDVVFNYQPLMISLGIQGNFGKVFK